MIGFRSNLLNNGIKFTNRGGWVRVSIDNSDGAVLPSIADYGIGMSAEDISVAMSSFGQIRNRAVTNQAGTGLGLPLERELVALHKCRFKITSKIGGDDSHNQASERVALRCGVPLRKVNSAAGSH
jgi:two-component system cell cycle sensor histidine kinase PleC